MRRRLSLDPPLPAWPVCRVDPCMRMLVDKKDVTALGETAGVGVDQATGSALAIPDMTSQLVAWARLSNLECAALSCDWNLGRVGLAVCPVRCCFLDSATEMNQLAVKCQRRTGKRLIFRRHVSCLARRFSWRTVMLPADFTPVCKLEEYLKEGLYSLHCANCLMTSGAASFRVCGPAWKDVPNFKRYA